MKRKMLVLAGVFVFAIVGILTLALVGYGIRRFQAAKVPPDAQYEALLRLQQDSERPVELYFENGFPRFVHALVLMPGANAVQRAQNFLNTYQDLYLQSSPDIKLAVRRASEVMGVDSVTFYQTYKGIPVYGGEIVVSLDGERVTSTVGGILTSKVDLDTTPSISNRDAEAIAREELNMPEAPLLGETSLIVFDYSLMEDVQPDPRLAWQVTLGGPTPWEAIVDAHTGEVVLDYSLALASYELDLEDSNNNTAANSNCYWSTTDDDWIGDEDGLLKSYHSDADAVGTWWFSQDVYNFFAQRGLDSYDNDGGEMEVYVHAGVNNASWQPGCDAIEFATGWVGWDVMVHEFTHGVINHSSNLVNAGQSRSLNESYSDSMAMVADPANWLMAENTTGNKGTLRDLSAMTANHMDMYDSGKSVYYNMGIPNTALYLIAEGGTQNGVTINGIGLSKMGSLYFATMRILPSSAKFIDARNLSVLVAAQWSQSNQNGFTPDDLCQVRNAFFAVGLGDPDLDCNGYEENPDIDNDSVLIPEDNCPDQWNPGQEDMDGDGIGNACDPDVDGDGVPEAGGGNWLPDNCPGVYNPKQTDANFNGKGKECDPSEDDDFDDDGVKNEVDNCPHDPNSGQENIDPQLDDEGDACDPDSDGDGLSNDNDNCPFTANPDQADTDGDGAGDACDKCPETEDVIAWTTGNQLLGIDPQPLQPDSDEDGIPDACDDDATLNAIPWGRAVKDLRPDGQSHPVEVRGDPETTLKMPIPPCPPDAKDGYSPEYRGLVQLEGLDTAVFARLINRNGQSVAKPRGINGSRHLRFQPRGGEQYFLLVGFGPGYPPGQVTPLTFAMSCEEVGFPTTPSGRKGDEGTPPVDIPVRTPETGESPAPTITPSPQLRPCILTALVNLFCRPAPGYNPTDSFRAGQSSEVIGQSDFLWQVLGPNFGAACTVPKDDALVKTEGSCEGAPIFTPLPPPTATPTSTPTPEVVRGCTVRQPDGSISCEVPCPAGAAPGEACTP